MSRHVRSSCWRQASLTSPPSLGVVDPEMCSTVILSKTGSSFVRARSFFHALHGPSPLPCSQESHNHFGFSNLQYKGKVCPGSHGVVTAVTSDDMSPE